MLDHIRIHMDTFLGEKNREMCDISCKLKLKHGYKKPGNVLEKKRSLTKNPLI